MNTDKAKGDVMREALLLAQTYIDYVNEHDQKLHLEANGTPEIDEAIRQAAAKHYSTVSCGDDKWPNNHQAAFDCACREFHQRKTEPEAQRLSAACRAYYGFLARVNPTPLPAKDDELEGEHKLGCEIQFDAPCNCYDSEEEKDIKTAIRKALAKCSGNHKANWKSANYARKADAVYEALESYLRSTPPQVDIEAGAKAIMREYWSKETIKGDWKDHIEEAKACASAWGLTEGGKAPDLAALEEAVLQVLDDMDCVASYDEKTDAPIWETDEAKKRTNCCIAAREQLIAAYKAIRQHAAQGGE